MSYFNARSFMRKAARASIAEREVFSKERIQKQLGEIKYLSSQRKIPKISLRKELVHLENELSNVFELEEYLLKRDKVESARIKALKKQVSFLKHRLEKAQDTDLRLKVGKLSHLLGECLAKQETQQKVQEVRTPRPAPVAQPVTPKARSSPRVVPDDNTLYRIETLKKRVIMLRHELELAQQLDEDIAKEKIMTIEKAIDLIDEKLKNYYRSHPELFTKKDEVKKGKHIMLFGKKEMTPPPPAPGQKVPPVEKKLVPPPAPSENANPRKLELTPPPAP